jgi:hypothetical protein
MYIYICKKLNMALLQTLMRIQFITLKFQISEVPSLTNTVRVICEELGRKPELCYDTDDPMCCICDFLQRNITVVRDVHLY